jgi:hypothetical protein
MSLKEGDLRDLVYNIFEIDSFSSKMGDDANIVTLSFSVKDKGPADDLVQFLESGYSFILDADATAGEQSDGTYKVFVELERNKESNEQIMEIIDGVSKLSAIDSFKFRYYKNWRSKPVTLEDLNSLVPLDPKDYGVSVTESNLNNYKNFFNKSYVDQIDLLDDILTIKKPFADPVQFNFIDFGPTVETIDSINESFNAEDFSEIIFLSKYIGDYNITKYGNKLTFDNNGYTLVLERIIV